MKIQRQLLRQDGLSEAQIDSIEQYCTDAENNGTFDRQGVLYTNQLYKTMTICKTVGDALLKYGHHKLLPEGQGLAKPEGYDITISE